MNRSCRDFRLVLEGRLDGRAAPERLGELAWNEHLFTCADCRALLDAEEALESLLASVPEPRLEPAVRARVLARLRSARENELDAERAEAGAGTEARTEARMEARLDRLLDVAADARPPAGLAAHVLAALASERGVVAATDSDVALDRLLELDVVRTPAGLEQRTLAALRLACAPARRRTASVRVLAYTAAAAAALVAVAWIARPDRTPLPAGQPWPAGQNEVVVEPREPAATPREPENGALEPRDDGSGANSPRTIQRDSQRVVQQSTPVSDEVLSVLDVLENWDVLVANDGDTLLTSLPTADEALLDAFEEQG